MQATFSDAEIGFSQPLRDVSGFVTKQRPIKNWRSEQVRISEVARLNNRAAEAECQQPRQGHSEKRTDVSHCNHFAGGSVMFYRHDTKNDENVSTNFENGIKKGAV